MASLYKKPVFIKDPRTGQRVKTKSKKWWGRLRDYRGTERRVPLARDKTAAQVMLNLRKSFGLPGVLLRSKSTRNAP